MPYSFVYSWDFRRFVQKVTKHIQLGTRLLGMIAFLADAEAAMQYAVLRLLGKNTSVYTWSGFHFGERAGNSLFTWNGAEAGRFDGLEIYGADGTYVGELRGGRLLTHQGKNLKRRSSFIPACGRSFKQNSQQVEGPPLPVGFRDFPPPDRFSAAR
jgi:hypothetical protein